MDFSVKSNKDEILKALREQTEAALEAVGLQAEAYAKLKCQVDSGLLRNSITHAVGGEGVSHEYRADKADKNGDVKSGSIYGVIGEKGDDTVYVGTNVEYAPYVEYGTSKTSPQPFLRPAVEDHTEEYKEIFEHYLRGHKNG